MSAARGVLPGRAAASPLAGPGVPLGRPPRGTCSPLPSPYSVRQEQLPGVWEKRPSGEDPANPDPLTSREAPGPGQGRPAEKRRAGGRAPPRLFREKVSAGAAPPAGGFLTRLGDPGLPFKAPLGIPLTPACQVHYCKTGRKTTLFSFISLRM